MLYFQWCRILPLHHFLFRPVSCFPVKAIRPAVGAALTLALSSPFSGSGSAAFVHEPSLRFVGSRTWSLNAPVVCFPKVGTATRALQKLAHSRPAPCPSSSSSSSLPISPVMCHSNKQAKAREEEEQPASSSPLMSTRSLLAFIKGEGMQQPISHLCPHTFMMCTLLIRVEMYIWVLMAPRRPLTFFDVSTHLHPTFH